MPEAPFKVRVKQALLNPSLRGALERFAEAYVLAREQVFAGRDFEGLRSKIATLKSTAALHLEELGEEFARQVTSRGGKVFFAKDAASAREYILKVVKEHGITQVVKSKSFATEEIQLNEYLARHGIVCYETDLAEWILQLMPGERPSHMVMPAIHLPKEEVARVFSRHLGRPVEPDIKTMVRIAREELRDKFLTAGLGISGANIAVAETGTLILLTNEGNARLATTLPPVHIAVVGYEKLVPRMKDVIPILEALPRSGTAQPITSYVTMITGPVPVEGSGEGALKELHVVLLDNGRLKMARDPVFREALQCIRCAACTNVCPVFQLVSGQVYGFVYSGGIGSILTAFFHSLAQAAEPQSLCIGCRRCTEVCPAKINIPDLVLELRKRIAREQGLPFSYRLALRGVVARPKLMRGFLTLGKELQRPITGGHPYIRNLPRPFKVWTEGRSLPALNLRPLRERIKDLEQPPIHPHFRAAFYAGCVIDFIYPEIGEAVFKVLQGAGVEVSFPVDQACCGIPAIYAGDVETALRLARWNIAALEEASADVVITACPTCAVALKYKFPHLLSADPGWYERALALAARVKDFNEVVQEMEIAFPLSSQGKKVKVTYHDSCHYKRHLGLAQVAREVLRRHQGLELVEMEESDRCCGFGGSYTLKYPEISHALLERKLQRILESGASIVVADCPGCLVQLRGGLDKASRPIQAKHTAEILVAGQDLW
ncbi:iron-sulfur cluster-binding protein [Thermanaeromonas toyohensis ToBE]|uniref:Iron-sulfur cluster-binding protein n=1 Tax=Thermanaeromonas toyohensis ToBE TaxID=698762 RepID=A0A1W1V9Q6_9FIRM|nr:LUD domain-containing protein [Thermanaeromonas toyohensis]SMB90187.1 iron-sulfur cluster-binding protein [Thermanaeromonas toyohensis ToBE]